MEVFADFLFIVFVAEVYVNVFVCDVVVFEELFSHFAPDTGA